MNDQEDLLVYLAELETVILPDLQKNLEELAVLAGSPEDDPDAKFREHDIEYVRGEIKSIEREIRKLRRDLGLEQVA